MSDLPSYFELQQMDEIEKLRREVKLMKEMCEEKNELEEENESLKLELNLGKSSLRCGQCGNIGMFHNGLAMADEITKLKEENEKLKKSREWLRKACEFYASSDQWNCTKEQLTTYNTIDKDDLGIGDFQFACDVDDDRVGGKKAREALEADDSLMKEV